MKQTKGPDDGARDTADSLARAARVQPIAIIGRSNGVAIAFRDSDREFWRKLMFSGDGPAV
jgi:hypothetical protein